MTARSFLAEIEGCYVSPHEQDALAASVLIAEEAQARILVAVAFGRLQRLSAHLEMITTLDQPQESEAVAIAAFVHPLLDEVCNLLRAADDRLAQSTGGRS